MKALRFITRAIIIAALAFVVGFGEYQIFIKGPEYCKPQSGTVIDARESRGKYSSCYLATIAFENGDIEEVNTGGHLYKKDDRFTGELSWNPILGICGTAYSWDPGAWYLFAILPACLFNIGAIIAIIFGIFYFAFSKPKEK